MLWSEIRNAYPKQWLIVEALEADSRKDYRQITRMAVIEKCQDGRNAMKRYRELHKVFPSRELYFVNTERPELTVLQRDWSGIRRSHDRSVFPANALLNEKCMVLLSALLLP